MTPPRAAVFAAAGLALLGAVACRAPGPPPKGAVRALWAGVESASLDHAELGGLVAEGVREIFYEAGVLSWESGAPRVRERLARPLPHAVAATLVITGIWNPPAESARSTAAAWQAAIGPIVRAAEERGAVPVGIHFELEVSAGLDELSAALMRLRRVLPSSLYLSAGLEPRSASDAEARELAQAVDFVVVTLYGQHPNEPEEPARWDLEAAGSILERLESLGEPYLLGGWTLGGARHRARDGATLGRSPGVPLGAMLRSTRWEARPGAVFQGLGRQVLELGARARAGVGDWTVDAGESVRIVRPNTSDVERFLAVSAAGGRRLGPVLRRLPAAGEALSLSVSNLREALRVGAAEPALEVTVESLASRRGRARLRVTLVNLNDEPTDYGTVEANFLELRLPRGVLRAVDGGEFVAWEQLWRGRERRTVRALREADTLRLYAGYLGGGERLVSGSIEVAGARSLERVEVRGSFLVPGGRELELAPRDLPIAAIER